MRTLVTSKIYDEDGIQPPGLKSYSRNLAKRYLDHFTIIPNTVIGNLLQTKELKANHIFIACWFAKACWANAKYCTKDTLLKQKPLKARLVKLKYSILEQTFDLSKDQLKSIIRTLEKHQLLSRQLIDDKWYVFVSDKLVDLFLSNEVKNNKGQISSGNIVLHEWFKLIKTDRKQTDFNGIMLISEVIYWSRFFELKDHDNDDDDQFNIKPPAPATQSATQIVSKSKGAVPFFDYKVLQNKFSLSYAQLKETISRLQQRDLLTIDVVRSKNKNKIVKYNFFLANFEKLTSFSKLDFKYKIPQHLNNSKLEDFLNFYTPYTYAQKYSINSTNIYPKQSKPNQRTVVTNRKFKNPKFLHQLSNCLSFFVGSQDRPGYSIEFLNHLLNKLSKRFPEHRFESKQKFIAYFKGILNQEHRDYLDVNNKTYFEAPLSLQEFLNQKLAKYQDKLKTLITGIDWEQVQTMLYKLANKGVAKLFNCLEGVANYLKKTASFNKTRDQIYEAFKDLPKACTSQMNRYLAKVEASYRSVSKEEHLRRRIAAKLPTQTAYRLLNTLRLFNTKLEGNMLILPTWNLTYCNLLFKGIKEAILNEVRSIYGCWVEDIRFVQAKPPVSANSAFAGQVQKEGFKANIDNQVNKQNNASTNAGKISISAVELELLIDQKMQTLQINAEKMKDQIKLAYSWKSDEQIEASIYVPDREEVRAMLLVR